MTPTSADSILPDPPNRSEAEALWNRIERAIAVAKSELAGSYQVPQGKARSVFRRETVIHMVDILEGRR